MTNPAGNIFPIFPLGPLQVLKGVAGAFSSPDWTVPTLSACPHRRDAPALISFLWPTSGPAPTGPCPSCAEGSRAEHSTPGEVSPEQSRGPESSLSTCWPRFSWCSPGHGWPSGLPAHIAGSCPAFCLSVPPSPSQQSCSRSFHPPACIDSGDL